LAGLERRRGRGGRSGLNGASSSQSLHFDFECVEAADEFADLASAKVSDQGQNRTADQCRQEEDADHEHHQQLGDVRHEGGESRE
jgi:hypothetical protein